MGPNDAPRNWLHPTICDKNWASYWLSDKVMNIWDWELILQDVDFGWEPRALDPDLKSFTGKIYIEKKLL